MHIVNFMGEKIELELDDAADLAIRDFLLAVKEVDGIGLVLPNGDSFTLESEDWEADKADAMQKNIYSGKPARQNLAWSIKDRAGLWERFYSDRSTTVNTLSREFERTPISIQNQLHKMGIVDQYGNVLDPSRRGPEPRKKYIYGTRSSGRAQL